MIIAGLIIGVLVVWFAVISARWYEDNHERAMIKILRLEVRPAHDGGECILCGSWCLPDGATQIIAVLPGGREMPVCDGCAADLTVEKIRQRLFSRACELRRKAQYYLALSRCKIELSDSDASFRDTVQTIKQLIWPGT